MSDLTDKQARFVEEYLVDLNATQAAIRAGYSARTAQEQGSRLLSNVKVSDAVASAQKARSERTGITAEQVINHLGAIGFSDIRRLFTSDGQLKQPHEMDASTAACISSIEVVTRSVGGGEVEHVNKIKFWDKNSALEKLAKHLGMFVDKSEVKLSNDFSHLSDEELNAKLEQDMRDLGWVRRGEETDTTH